MKNFSNFFDKHNGIIMLIEPDSGKILYANLAAEKYYGYSNEKLCSMEIEQIFVATPEKIINIFNTVLKREENTFYIQQKTSNGIVKDAEVHCSPITIGNKELIFTSVQYVLDYDKIVHSMFDTNEQMKFVLENSSDIIVELDIQGNILFISRLSKGFDKKDVIGKNLSEWVSPEYKEILIQTFEKVIKTGAKRDVEVKGAGDNGELRWYHTILSPVLIKGKVSRVILTTRDITLNKNLEDELNKSEIRFRALAQNSPVGIFLTDSKQFCTYVNKKWCEISGLNYEESIGSGWLNAVHPDDIENFKKQIENSEIKTDQSFYYEFRFLRKDGSVVWVIGQMVPEFDSLNNINGFVGTITDITVLKKSELALKDSEYKFRQLYDSMMDAYVKVDLDGFIIESNQTYRDMLGYTEEELKEMTYVDLTPEKWHAIEKEIVGSQIYTRGYSDVYQKEYIKKNGTVFPIELRSTLVLDPENKPRGIWTIIRDITDRKINEQVIRSRLKLLLFAEKNSKIDVLQRTLDILEILTESEISFFHFINENNKDIDLQAWSTNTRKNMCTAKPIEKHYKIDDAGVWADCARTGEIIIHNDFENLSGKKGMPVGHAKIIREITVPIKRGGKVVAIIGLGNKKTEYTENDIKIVSQLADLAWDISEKKRIEELVYQSESDLKKLNAEKDKFFSIIAHDLRSPFNGVLGLIDIMAKDTEEMTPKEIKTTAINLNASVTNLYRLLINLLEWSSMQRGFLSFNPEQTSLIDVVNLSIVDNEDMLNKKNIYVNINIENDIKVFADVRITELILRNLISNAIKFSNKKSKINISAYKKEENEIEVKIEDSGIGMDKETLDGLFHIDADIKRKGTEGEPGTGLGLLLCKEFVEKSNGKIWAESEVNKGSTFYFTLPSVK